MGPDGSDRRYKVLFLCTGNSARSIMAEAILSRVGAGKFDAFSAGSQPKGAVHPRVVQKLQKLNYDVAAFRSKSWEEFSGPDAPHLDFVFTMCDAAAREVCPVWAGQPVMAHWGVPDPAAVRGADAELAFEDAWRVLRHRITLFCDLPIDSLERRALKRRLEEIGRVDGSACQR